MIGLILSDLSAHARVWIGTLAVAITAGFVGALAAGLIETGIAHGGQVQKSLDSSSSVVIMFTAITALIVLNSSANLAVALQQRSYALWQLVGIRPSYIGLVVLAQLVIVAALGAMIGCLAALPAFEPLFDYVFRVWDGMSGITLHLGITGASWVTAAVTATVVLGGLRGARRASRTPPIEALREPEPPKAKMGWFRWLVLAGTLTGTVSLAANLNEEASLSTLSGQAMLLTPLIAAVFAAAGPVLYPLVLRAWTSLVPAGMSATWYLARHSARHKLAQSTAAISPLMVAITLAGGLYTTGATLGAAYVAQNGGDGRGWSDIPVEGVVLLLGGPLLLSAVGAAATVFMSGQAREREFALVQAAGSTRAAILVTALWEAVVYAVTAALLGAAATVIGGFALSSALGLAAPTVPVTAIGFIAGGGFLLILAATVGPTAAALRHEIPRTLAVE